MRSHSFLLDVLGSTRNVTASLELFFNLYWFYLCLFVCSKQSDFLLLRVLFQKENFSIVSCLAPLVQDRLWLKLGFLFTWIIVKVTKTSSNMKSRVFLLATLGSVYSPCVAIFVILRVKWSVGPLRSVVSCQTSPEQLPLGVC